jgi:hypothetical protein
VNLISLSFGLVYMLLLKFYKDSPETELGPFLPQAYVEQLETSRLKLAQLEKELQRACQQVFSLPFSFEFEQVALLCRTSFFDIDLFIQGIFISSSGNHPHSTCENGKVFDTVLHSKYLGHNVQYFEEISF